MFGFFKFFNCGKKCDLVDDVSNLIIDGENFRGYETGDKIESYLYGNEYGKATIR